VAEVDKIALVSPVSPQFSFHYPVSLRWLKSTLTIASYLDISEEGSFAGVTHAGRMRTDNDVVDGISP